MHFPLKKFPNSGALGFGGTFTVEDVRSALADKNFGDACVNSSGVGERFPNVYWYSMESYVMVFIAD